MPLTVERCFSCHASVPRIQGPTHDYMTSSPGCWKLFTGLLDALQRDGPAAAGELQDVVDAYAAQHPGRPGRRESQSVHLHLTSLYLGLEHGFDARARQRALQALLRGRPAFAWLEPPSFANTLTVADVVACRSDAARREAIGAWAASVWDAWKPHRATVAGVVARILG